MNKFNNSAAAFAAFIIGAAIVFSSAAAPAAPSPAKPAAAAPNSKAPADSVVDAGWSERCADKDKTSGKKSCEVYTRLEMKSSNMRVTEVAVGFPQDNSLPKGTARGVIILPLGVMLEPGATMAIDDGKPFAFKARFCTQAGCFCFVNMNKDILGTMKKGKELNIYFKTADNHDAHLTLGLKGFDKAIDKIN